jgi:hypothetical protein
LIRHLYTKYPRGTVLVLTPTHKAASLYGDLPGANQYVMTIHRFFKCQLDYSDEGEQVFQFKAPTIPDRVRLIVVDEASMVSTQMMGAFSELDIPILYTCDRCQLPPVKEEKSPIYDLPHRAFTLTRNMRSGSARDQCFVDAYRANVENPDARHAVSRTPAQVTGMQIVAGLDGVVLVWTNVRRNYWNQFIRSNIFADRGPRLDRVYAGERLVFSGCRRVDPDFTYYSSDVI